MAQCELKDIEILNSKFEQCDEDLHIHLSFKEVIPKDEFIFDPHRNYIQEMDSKQKLRYYRATSALNKGWFPIAQLKSSAHILYYTDLAMSHGRVKIAHIKLEDASKLDLIEEDLIFLQSDLSDKHDLLFGHILGLL
jgi:hypothetical protein